MAATPPATGRWTAKDSSLFRGGDSNLFAYAVNNPVTLLDPSGLWYVDFNFSYGASGVGVTMGIQIGTGGIFPYAGGGITTPGPGGSVTFSGDNPSAGWSWGGQLTARIAYQHGNSIPSCRMNRFDELGFGGPPGASLTAYRAWQIPMGPATPEPPAGGVPPVNEDDWLDGGVGE